MISLAGNSFQVHRDESHYLQDSTVSVVQFNVYLHVSVVHISDLPRLWLVHCSFKSYLVYVTCKT